jgi:hypothetical protein
MKFITKEKGIFGRYLTHYKSHRKWLGFEPESMMWVVFFIYNVEINLQLSLCLTKHHTMKAYWESGVISPLIL